MVGKLLRYTSLAMLSLVFQPLAAQTVAEQAEQITHLAASLSEEQQALFHFPWTADERLQWEYRPSPHHGLPLSAMGEGQQQQAVGLLDSALSARGAQTARQIIALEADAIRANWFARLWVDPEAYFVSLFGDPAGADPWSWRFEGHHLSLNMTVQGNQIIAATPYFIGANPTRVEGGEMGGVRVLAQEEDLARRLMTGLPAAQQQLALISEEAPADILTLRDARVQLACCQGLSSRQMNEAQRELLDALVQQVTGQLDASAVQRHRTSLGEGELFFAWAGSVVPGEGHYYRIQGQGLLIEYDNTQGDASHIHLVWRDPARDFGHDLLGEHYAQVPHH